ncbi:MAG TPA: dihydrofolate reductase family protein, partial [Microbacteriaceae bacterium]|nr:dihydrofolate reductase family protein [Microbacteriaceae bacterium]
NIAISLDGFATGEGQSLSTPFGHAGMRLMEWFFPTETFQSQTGHRERQPVDGSAAPDDEFARRAFTGFGAEIMGSGKFGPPGWHDDPAWRGWWGEEPPFHTPVFVLTHHPRPEIAMEGGTTFHFLDASPAEALEVARAAARDLDVRLGGGPTTIREFLAAGLVDLLHVVQVPIILGRGVRLWDGLEGLEAGYDIESVTTPSGVTHLTFTRRD